MRKTLPRSPRKTAAVVWQLANILKGALEKSSPERTKALSAETIQAVKEFYICDDITRQVPEITDCIVIRTEHGSKEKRQKRHMIMTVQEAHKLFLEEYGDSHPIGQSKFAKHRPKHVLTMSEMPGNTCFYIQHENVKLLVEAIPPKLWNSLTHSSV